jgi:hypothetical protein
LEDLLAFDDIFLDYFNHFLKHKSFPLTLQYNRYLGIFEEIPNENGIIHTDQLPKQLFNHLNAKRLSTTATTDQHPFNDDEKNSFGYNSGSGLVHQASLASISVDQNKLFDWVRTERLPLFFRTDLFREFKLCKLLTRSLEEYDSSSRNSSQMIGGYSRQSRMLLNCLFSFLFSIHFLF